MRRVMLMMVLVLSLFLLVACGGSSTTTEPETVEVEVTRIVEGEAEVVVVTATPEPEMESMEAEGEVVLWSAHGGNLGAVLQDLVFRFNSEQQAVSATNEFQGNYYDTLQKFLAGMAAGTVPDVVQLDCMYTPFLAANGAYASLDELVYGPNGVDVNDLQDGFRLGDQWNGEFYAWSFSRSTPLLYINADAFIEAGLDPVPPATWAELVDLATQLTKTNADGETEQYGFMLPLRNWWYLESMFRSNGGRMFDPETNEASLDEPEQLEVLQAIDSLIEEGIFTTAPNSSDANSDFLQGKAAMAYQSTGSLKGIKESADFQFEVGFIPKWDEYAVTPGGACFGIPSGSENKAAAWEFIKWITSPEITGEYATRTGYLPLRKSALETDRMEAFYNANPKFVVAVDQTEFAVQLPLIKAVPSVVEDFFSMQEEIFLSDEPLEDIVAEYDQRMTDAFQSWLDEQP